MNKKSEYVILYKNRDPYKAGPWKEEEVNISVLHINFIG